jgi:CBS domain-containing protein
MTRNVVTVEPEDTLREVVETLTRERVSGAPVMQQDNIVGVISRSDILDFLASTPAVPTTTPQFAQWGELESADGEDNQDEQDTSFYTDLWEDAGADVVERFSETQGPEWDLLSEYTASAVMTRKLEVVSPRASVRVAARRMVERGIHRLLVIDNDALAGVVSMTDLVRLIARGARVTEP